MADSRLSLALETGAVALPESGRIVVYGPTDGHDLGALPKDRVQVVQGFKPLHDHFQALGYDTQVAPTGDFAAAIVFLPRARPLARLQIAQARALVGDGVVIVDGQKTDGVDSMLRDCRKRGDVLAPLSKAHGKLFAMRAGPDAFADWAAPKPPTQTQGFVTAPGVFSADKIDRGSAFLAAHLPDRLKGAVADFGAGWGYLSAQLTKYDTLTELHLVEADHSALDCARRNISDPRAQFHWADVTGWKAPGLLDAIITNPPFHTGRAAEPALGQAFLRAAAGALAPSGQLWVVANRHLPYERILADQFRKVDEIAAETGFKILHATQPLTPARRGR